jgi:hypothetical protein
VRFVLAPNITTANVDDVVRLLNAPTTELAVKSISLSASLELAAWYKTVTAPDRRVEELRAHHQYVRRCIDILNGSIPRPPARMYSSPPLEFFAIRKPNEVLADRWNRFLERFSASLRARGFKPELSHGIAGALHEMADNVVQHSAADGTALINGLAAYAVDPGNMCFVVGDLGIGAFRSLKLNPAWKKITTSREALTAIVHEHASRRIGEGAGQGFQTLFQALAGFNGAVRLRSSNGAIRVEGTGGQTTSYTSTVPMIPGLQLSVFCRVK